MSTEQFTESSLYRGFEVFYNFVWETIGDSLVDC